MASPNLNISHVAATQTDKEITINDAVDALDSAGNGFKTYDCSAAGTTITASAFRYYGVHRMQNNVSARSVTLPVGISRLFVFINEGSADGSLIGGSVTVSVVAGSAVLFYAYGSTLKRVK